MELGYGKAEWKAEKSLLRVVSVTEGAPSRPLPSVLSSLLASLDRRASVGFPLLLSRGLLVLLLALLLSLLLRALVLLGGLLLVLVGALVLLRGSGRGASGFLVRGALLDLEDRRERRVVAALVDDREALQLGEDCKR